ncbi:MAG: transaldolase [Actinobacteria bacterium]|nr:transaldolase [Actinomycetota bacterium]
MSKSRLHQLSELGQSVWIDYLSRDMIHQGELERMMQEDAVVGVTSNPTIFQKAISHGNAYDEQLRELIEEHCETVDAFFRLAERDVGDACDLFHGVWEETAGRDGYVSIEVDPNLAYEREATFEQAKELHERINKPNLLVKIPGMEPCLGAIEDSIAAGRSINITLIFSLPRYKEVVTAYQRGIERLIEDGGDPSRVASVASFFVSRVDTEADKRLDEIGTEQALALRGQLAIANAKLAYAHYLEAFSTDSWKALEEKGATRQRCLWASTSTKNPDYRDTLYVEELIGPETVNTMPEETIEAFQDHGQVAETLTKGIDEAKRVFEGLAEVGVDYDDVTAVLEKEGVDKFSDSFRELLEGIKAKRGELVSA